MYVIVKKLYWLFRNLCPYVLIWIIFDHRMDVCMQWSTEGRKEEGSRKERGIKRQIPELCSFYKIECQNFLQRKEWEYKGELSNQSFCISISMFVERPKVHQALQNCCTFWEVPWKSLGGCWWGEVFRWHSKWVNHLFHRFQSQVWSNFLQPLWTHYWQCMFLTQWRCLSIILLQLDQTKINCYSVGKSVFIFEV